MLSSGEVIVGLAMKAFLSNEKPGRTNRGGQSFGYSNNGQVATKNDNLFTIEKYDEGDIIGIGINFIRNEIFFTKNGIMSSTSPITQKSAYRFRRCNDSTQ